MPSRDRIEPGRRARGLGLVGASLSFALAAFAPTSIADAGPPPGAAAQRPALDLSAYRGKVVYLDFWASWCGPCQLSFPFMNQLRSSAAPNDLAVIAVNLDRDGAAAQRFLREHQANFTIVYDPAGQSAAKYKVGDMPTSILIGRDGRVRYIHKGFFAKDEPVYRQHLAELLREK